MSITATIYNKNRKILVNSKSKSYKIQLKVEKKSVSQFKTYFRHHIIVRIKYPSHYKGKSDGENLPQVGKMCALFL